MLVWVPGWQQLVVGVVVAFFVTLLMNGFFTGKAQFLKRPICYWYFLGRYVPRFLWECFKANIDVAYRVLHPALPINPGIVKVKTVLKSDVGLTFLANSITLTPGTMTVDIDKDNGVLYIHCINVEKTDVKAASKIIVEKFEKILVKIFE
jgi:multicomponent Na+:H+ antiporter subunit E